MANKIPQAVEGYAVRGGAGAREASKLAVRISSPPFTSIQTHDGARLAAGKSFYVSPSVGSKIASIAALVWRRDLPTRIVCRPLFSGRLPDERHREVYAPLSRLNNLTAQPRISRVQLATNYSTPGPLDDDVVIEACRCDSGSHSFFGTCVGDKKGVISFPRAQS